VLASVAVPTVERASAPIRCWSTMMAVVSPSSTSTSGRASVGMKPCTKALYVSLISRCDSAAIVSNTRELLPEPETPVNTVSRRFGISTLTSLRLFSRAPCTRIRSWLSATCGAGGCVPLVMAVVIVSPSVWRGRGAPFGRAAAPRSAAPRRCCVRNGAGAHGSWSSPRTLPSGSVTVATRRPPPTSRTGSFTAAPAPVTSASFASMSGTCQ